ncbi:hypothetical protein GCHA_2162 [Paraglaciecola chathamensis S18K6]|uniref:Transposase n=1 Tax=Paraglaciecola chathamensis S18K6 TaxID=1127672 RepID=A0AAV3UZL1_9ALTE|nr:hypothetical protein GCHA_2162 [Paraglaciecola chathamensis S18K6]
MGIFTGILSVVEENGASGQFLGKRLRYKRSIRYVMFEIDLGAL